MGQEELKYEKLNSLINNQNVKQADLLVDELLWQEEIEIDSSMPEGFADKIRFASKGSVK